jgi:hypothetical protein
LLLPAELSSGVVGGRFSVNPDPLVKGIPRGEIPRKRETSLKVISLLG